LIFENLSTNLLSMAGNHGGRRPGAGRPQGRQDLINRFTRSKQVRADITEFLRTNPEGIFDGDSLELAVSVYKNENLPLNLRLHALALAIPYERPRLVASASVTRHIEGDDASFGRLFQQIEERLALAPPEQRGQVIEMLRADGDGQ
jgi:hypothetical protein